MFSYHISIILAILQILFMLTMGWHVLLKGKRNLDNLWLFIYLFSTQFLVSSLVVAYFPFYSPLFFISFLAVENFLSLFIYSFPRSIKLNRRWLYLFSAIDIVAALIFTYFSEASAYIATGALFFGLNLSFVIRKVKYISLNKKGLVLLLTGLSSLKSLLLSLSIGFSLLSYNVAYVKHFVLLFLPIYYLAAFCVTGRKISSGTKLSSFLMQLFLFLSIPFSILSLQMSAVRVAIFNFFSEESFFYTAVFASFFFYNVLSVIIYNAAAFLNSYFNARHVYFQKILHRFRARTEEAATYDQLFRLFDRTIRERFREVSSIRYIVVSRFAYREEVPLDVEFLPDYAGKILLRWFEKTREPFLLRNSVDFPPGLIPHYEEIGGDLLVPVTGRRGVMVLIRVEGRIKRDVANAIANLASVAGHGLMRIALYEKIVDRERKLQESRHFHEVDKMVSLIAHEIRTPLTSIMFNMEVLSESLSEMDQADREFLEIACNELGRLNATVDKMLTYGRNIQLSPEMGSFDTFLGELRYLFLSSNGEGIDISFDNRISGEYMLDWQVLKQVLTNLVNNSIEAIRSSGKGDTVSVKISRDMDWLQIDVEDNSSGIPDDVVDSIFESFFTTKKSGNGLGLAICKKIVKIMGGRINLQRTGEKGTVFSICLPASDN